MDQEIDSLKEQITFLERRISELEKKENHRQVLKYLSLIWKILLIGAFAFGAWKAYDYVVNGIPKMIENKISDLNTLKKKN